MDFSELLQIDQWERLSGAYFTSVSNSLVTSERLQDADPAQPSPCSLPVYGTRRHKLSHRHLKKKYVRHGKVPILLSFQTVSKCPVKTLFGSLFFLLFCRHIQTHFVFSCCSFISHPVYKGLKCPVIEKRSYFLYLKMNKHTHKKKTSKKLE